MAVQGRRALTIVNGVRSPIPTGDWVLGAGDAWVTTTQYQQGQTRRYFGTASTDSNGRITVYATKDGTAAGTALFSQIFGFSCTYRPTSAPTSALQVPTFFVESVSTDLKTIVFRSTQGVGLLALGATMQFGGAGAIGNVQLTGLAA